MARHPRLGEESAARILTKDCLKVIGSFVPFDDASKHSGEIPLKGFRRSVFSGFFATTSSKTNGRVVKVISANEKGYKCVDEKGWALCLQLLCNGQKGTVVLLDMFEVHDTHLTIKSKEYPTLRQDPQNFAIQPVHGTGVFFDESLDLDAGPEQGAPFFRLRLSCNVLYEFRLFLELPVNVMGKILGFTSRKTILAFACCSKRTLQLVSEAHAFYNFCRNKSSLHFAPESEEWRVVATNNVIPVPKASHKILK